jgi:plastocyanin
MVSVRISDSRITLSKYRVHDVTYVDFYLHNTGKLAHNFAIGTQESQTLAPGERLHFFVGFPVYGYYHYRSTVHPKPAMRGRFKVEAPQPPD